MNHSTPIKDRTGQVFVGDHGDPDVLLILGRGTHEHGVYIPAWTMVDLVTHRQIVMSEDWVATQVKMGNIVGL